MVQKGIDVNGTPPEQPSLLTKIFINWFPTLLLIAIWLFVMRQMQGGGRGGGGLFSFGKSRARLSSQDRIMKKLMPEIEKLKFHIKVFAKDTKKF